MAEVPRRLWVAVIVGTVLVVVLVAIGLWARSQDDEVVLRVDEWSMTRNELDQRIEDVVGNVLYLQAREQRRTPLPVPQEGEPWPPQLVGEILNEALRFHLAAVALEQRGGVVTISDREAAVADLARLVLGGASLDDPRSTLDVVLSQFGEETRAYYEDGTATVWALRRVLAAESGVDADDPSMADRVDAAIREVAGAARIEVAPDLGTWDPDSGAIVARDPSRGVLTPEEPGGGAAIPPDDGTRAPVGAGPTAPTPVGPPSAAEGGP